MMGQGREALVVCSERMKTGITIWDMDTGDEILRIPSCAASPHGFLCLRNQRLVASQVNRHGSLGGGTIFMWALDKPQPPHRSYTVEAVGPLSCTKDGVYLAGGTLSGNAYLWEVSSGRMLNMWHAHYKSVKCMVFSDDGSLLISGSDDGMICIWSVIRLMKETSKMMHHSDHLDLDQSMLEVEDLESSPSLLHYSVEHQLSITGLLTLSGGTGASFVSSSLDATCKVWDMISGRIIQTRVYPIALTVVTFHPGQQLLLTGSVDGRIFINTLQFELLEDSYIVAEDQPGVLKGHNAPITALAISTSYLISASEDKTVCLWDVNGRMIIRRFNHQKGAVTNLVVILQSSLLSVSNHQSKSKRNRISSLQKYISQPEYLSKEMITLLHSRFSTKDDQYSIHLQRAKSLYGHMSELQQEGTPASMQRKAEISMNYRTWVAQMTKHVMEMNKHLQSRLLDLIEYRLLWYRETDSAPNKSRKKRKTETPVLLRKEQTQSV